MPRNKLIVAVCVIALCAFSTSRAAAQSTLQSTTEATTEASDQQGPLRIHVTAVQGGAQYRPDANSKWTSVTAGLDLTEGVEFRTGPKGVIQFTVGSDQVFRVDRLTVVKMLRANLNADGTIRTDVGMTYGRVSKDVDLPSHPHQDTIISPSSTLAVRGTRVSLYDQPPYEPQAVSLTGQAYFQNLHHELIRMGSHGSTKVKVNGSSSSPGEYELTSTLIDPNGAFSGRTDTEFQTLIATLGGLNGNQLGVFQNVANSAGTTPGTGVIGSLPIPGELMFEIFWSSSTTDTIVQFAVTSPLGDTVSFAKQMSVSGGSYNTSTGSPVANFGTFGEQEIDWGTSSQAFPNGKYKITTTLTGSVGAPLTPTSATQISESVFVQQTPPGGITSMNPGTSTYVGPITLSAKNPRQSFSVSVPVFDNEGVNTTNSNGKRSIITVPPG